MTAREYLSQAYRLDQRINSKLDQIISLNDLAAKCTTTFSDMPRTPSNGSSAIEDAIAKIVDLQSEINTDIDCLVDLKRDLVRSIKAVENTELRTLLELRYLCFKTWKQIAIDMGYNIRHIYRLHEDSVESWVISKTGTK
jgi:DNA-directed RNA polymerase specialized sigma subunit